MSSLTSYLAKKGAVDPGRLQKALLNQAIRGGSAGLNLLEVEAIEEASLVEMTGSFHHLPALSAAECLGAGGEAASLLPRARCEELHILPIRRAEDHILVACVEPPSRTDRLVLERDAGMTIKLAVASPVAVAVGLALLHDLPLGERVARIALRLGEDALGLETLPGEVADRVREILASPHADEPAHVEEEAGEDDDWDLEDEEEEEEAPEQGRDSLVGKYIIINRIGARPRRPSMQTQQPRVDQGVHDQTPEEESPPGAEVTFTDGGLKAGEDTRPHRPSAPPPGPVSQAPRKRDSVPPSILKEVVEEYLQDDLKPPSRVKPGTVRRTPPPARAPERPAEPVRVMRAVSVTTPLPSSGVTQPPRTPEKEHVETKSLPTVPVLENLKSAAGRAVQGYAVDVPELAGLSDVLAEIEEAQRASDITDAVHRFALQFFDFVLMLRYRRGRFELGAASSRGWAWPLAELPVQVMGYDQLPETVRKLGQPHLGPVDSDGRIADIIRAVGRPLPPNAMLMPISIKGRAIVLIYGDNGDRPTTFEEVHDLFHATWVATNCLLALLEERRR